MPRYKNASKTLCNHTLPFHKWAMLLGVLLALFPHTTQASNSTAVCSPEDYLNVCLYGSCCVTSPCCTTSGVEQVAEDIFNDYREDFIMDSFYTDTWEPDGLIPASDSLRRAFGWLPIAYGAVIDGSVLMDTLRDLQVSNTQTLKNYTPSTQICRFGTLSRALAASDAKVTTTQLALSEAALSRSLGTIFSSASSGRGLDNQSRLFDFVNTYCDLGDNSSGLNQICDSATPPPEVNQARDIDFTRTIDSNITINADFTDGILADDEHNVIALGNFLYGHKQPVKRFSKSETNDDDASKQLFREYRSIYARRAAAQNTYNTIAAMKAAGSGASDTFLSAALQQLGLGVGEIRPYLYAETSAQAGIGASYYAQMDILTKRIYQDPRFYSGLMNSRPNINRATVAMGGIGLIQKRDLYRSAERSELLLGLLVELEARKAKSNTNSPE